jgi:putative membrane protein
MKLAGVFFRGLAMGAADVVPGVSGGTIAFITGIYGRLLDAISGVSPALLSTLRREGFAAAWKQLDGTFLLTLGSGILVAIASLAKVIHYLLMHHPIALWAFFFGLIIASCWHIGRTIQQWRWQELAAIALGTVVAGWISMASPTEIEASLPVVFVAGSIAICAMILPGISGSFMLLLMGLYGPVMAAIKGLDLPLLGTFAAGALLGLLLFSRLLSWLLHHFESVVLALLTGFMVGSLVKVWPWKETLLTRINSKGEEVPFIQSNVLPQMDISLWWALGLMFAGAILVLGMERLTTKKDTD